MKDDVVDFKKNLFGLVKQLEQLELENKNLKFHNKNLASFAKNYINPYQQPSPYRVVNREDFPEAEIKGTGISPRKIASSQSTRRILIAKPF